MSAQLAEPVAVRRPDHWLRRTFAQSQAWLGAGLLAAVVLWALLGPLLAPLDPVTADPAAFGLPPGRVHWFGTNAIGQDLYAQTLLGLRTSLAVGFVAAPVATAIGALVGAVAGYAGGWLDRALVWLVDLAIVVPSLSNPRAPIHTFMYVPSWVEWSLMAGCFAAFALLYMGFTKLFPIVAIWELESAAAPASAAVRPSVPPLPPFAHGAGGAFPHGRIVGEER